MSLFIHHEIIIKGTLWSFVNKVSVYFHCFLQNTLCVYLGGFVALSR